MARKRFGTEGVAEIRIKVLEGLDSLLWYDVVRMDEELKTLIVENINGEFLCGR